MSGRPRRNIDQLDYKALHTTGQKVIKSRSLENLVVANMAQADMLKVQEELLVAEIADMVDIGELLDEYEVDRYKDELKSLRKKIREVHIRIRIEMGADEHKEWYPDIENYLDQLKKKEVEASSKKRDLIVEKEEKIKQDTFKQSKESSEKCMKVLLFDISEFCKDSLECICTLKEVDEKISKAEYYIESLNKVCVESESALGSIEYETLHAGRCVEVLQELRNCLTQCKKIRKALEQIKEENVVRQNVDGGSSGSEIADNGRNEKEIEISRHLLKQVFDMGAKLIREFSITVADLEDVEILDKKKNVPSLDSKIDRLLAKSIEFRNIMPVNFENKDVEWKRVTDMIDKVNQLADEYISALDKETSKRGVNKHRLGNESNLKINISKFRGYDSSSDIYSFQAEFEKLISPAVKVSLLPDYLKNNFLEGSALLNVRGIDKMEDIWQRLKTAYGDTEVLLQNKLREIKKDGPIWKIKDPERFMESLSKLIYAMLELQKLASQHKIENELYYGGSIETIYDLIGYKYREEFIAKNCQSKHSKKEIWDKIIQYLRDKLAVKEQLVLIDKTKLTCNFRQKSGEDKPSKQDRKEIYHSDLDKELRCHLCGSTSHVSTTDFRGKKVIEYYACGKFANMTPKERFELLKEKGLCRQCLNPGVKETTVNHKDCKCYSRFACKNKHDGSRKLHVLVCDSHKHERNNLTILEEYKRINMTKNKSVLPEYSRNIRINFHSLNHKDCESNLFLSQNESENSVFLLQTINVEDKQLNLFYDSGCQDLVAKKETIDRLEVLGRASSQLPGPVSLFGVGNQKSKSMHGIYSVRLPLFDGRDAVMSGVCLDRITSEFPIYPLKGEVEEDIHSSYRKSGFNVENLPSLPKQVGGETDLMIGIQYLKYFPEQVFKLPSGLTLYRSYFRNVDGSRGVVGGPHQVFSEIAKLYSGNYADIGRHCSEQAMLAKFGYRVSLDLPLLGIKNKGDPDNEVELQEKASYECKRTLKVKSHFDQVENAGTEVTFRCIDCRNCNKCKSSEKTEFISLQEEIEQDVIDRSVQVDTSKGVTIAKLPFVGNPELRLLPNKRQALAIYKGQTRKLSKIPSDKNDVIKSESKLQSHGYVDFLENLSDKQRLKIENSKVKYFIPWRAVWNSNSISTPCRLVFDASQVTDSGYSLNNILAKGRNGMNKLVEIVIRWMSHKYAFHTDIQKMYNAIKLDEDDWCYQLYLWDNDLSLDKQPKVKVIKTLIYGVKSSGNQAERGLRHTAESLKEDHLRSNEIIQKDIYVDDCISGEESWSKVMSVTDDLTLVLNKGGFSLKGFTFSGKDPPRELSSDGKSINVAGMKWHPKDDKISLDIGELNFARKQRGKKPTKLDDEIPSDFTRRDCVGRVAEVFDLLGKVTPVICGMKLDLRELVVRNLDWDDKIPNDLKEIWLANFQTIKDLGAVRFNRVVIPSDAVSLDIETIDIGDASHLAVCSAIYARVKRSNGDYSCQLVFARSKLVQGDVTIPRAELLAALLNANTGHIVKVSFGKLHKKCVKLTDSQVVLHWLSNKTAHLKQWVRNRVIEVNRLADCSLWRYIDSKNNIADLGTRKGAKLNDVTEDSKWIKGLKWMNLGEKEFPVKTVEQLRLSSKELTNIKNEYVENSLKDFIVPRNQEVLTCSRGSKVSNETVYWYKFSNYVIDPNKFRLDKVVSILALVMLFIRNLRLRVKSCKASSVEKEGTEIGELLQKNELLKQRYIVTAGNTYKISKTTKISCKKGLVIYLSRRDLVSAWSYFYRKATEELKEFSSKKIYKSISIEREGILFYKGRILPNQEFGGRTQLSDVVLDLTSTTFCVPLVDARSPFAYSIVNETHWYNEDALHAGVETVLRYAQKIAHVIEGRELVKKFKKMCIRCRILEKRVLDVCMGPVKQCNLNIAPAFYMTQVDISGPYLCYSSHNKRATLKIWFIVFCCSTTGAVDIKVMEDYSTTSFFLGFVRFACKVGYPKMLMPDEGSQLIKGCKDMQIDFSNLQCKLSRECGVDFQTCPVGAHNVHGKVERKIRHIQESMEKRLCKDRLSLIQWETLGTQIANSINNLPIALGNQVSDLENADILTPNRLMLGRNNSRSPVGALVVSNNSDKIMQTNLEIFTAWFECWLISYVPKLMRQPKWFNSSKDIKIGDIVLFLKNEKEFARQYQYGRVKSVRRSTDGRIRDVGIEYCNFNEVSKRETRRPVRNIVMIHPVDELGILQELGEISRVADLKLAIADSAKT